MNVYRQCDVSIEKKIDQSECVKFFEDRHDSEGMTHDDSEGMTHDDLEGMTMIRKE